MNIIQMIKDILNIKRVPFLQGTPGIGKSDIIRQIAKEANLKVIDIRLSMCDITDLNGLPNFKEGRSSFIPFDIFPIEGDTIPDGYKGWLLFLDEFNSAPKYMQAAAYKIILDKMVGTHKLHSKVHIVCAGNNTTDRAITTELSTAMKSRLVHIKMEPSFDDWRDNVAIPNKYSKEVIGYLGAYPDNLNKFDPNTTEDTFPCPRTWEFVNDFLKLYEKKNAKLPSYTQTLISGMIGTSTAAHFMTFIQCYNKIPTYKEILAEPEKTKVPDNLEYAFAILSLIIANIKKEDYNKIAKYVNKLSDQNETMDLLFTSYCLKHNICDFTSVDEEFLQKASKLQGEINNEY